MNASNTNNENAVSNRNSDVKELERKMREGRWEEIDFSTVYWELDEMTCTNAKKNRVYKKLYMRLLVMENENIWKYQNYKIWSWPFVIICLPLGLALIVYVLTWFWRPIWLIGVPVSIYVMIDTIKNKFEGRKAINRLNHLKKNGFNLYCVPDWELWDEGDDRDLNRVDPEEEEEEQIHGIDSGEEKA